MKIPWNYNQIEIKCLICNKPFNISPSMKYKRKHCSKKCDAISRSIIIKEGMKTCNKCHQLFSISEFSKDRKTSNGYCRICKKCQYNANKDYIIRNKEKINKKRR